MFCQAVKNNLEYAKELKWQYVALEQNYVINFPAARICWSDYEPRLRYACSSATPTKLVRTGGGGQDQSLRPWKFNCAERQMAKFERWFFS